MRSLLHLVSYTRYNNASSVDFEAEGSFWLERISSLVAQGNAQRRRADGEAFFDVDFDTFVSDNVGQLKKALKFAGAKTGGAAMSAVRDFSSSNRRKQSFHYPLEMFGLTEADVRMAFKA